MDKKLFFLVFIMHRTNIKAWITVINLDTNNLTHIKNRGSLANFHHGFEMFDNEKLQFYVWKNQYKL